MKLFILLCAFALYSGLVRAEDKDDVVVEQTTESPIADMAVVDATPTETLKAEKEKIKQTPENSQQHTIADFIIHPLIALKPRVPETENGKQSDGSSTTSSPWQLFGFNPGQGLGSSVSSLAGSVTGWLGNRIQLPGFVETPVREPSTTSTVRPDIVVRLQQRPATKKPLIAINNNNNERPYRRFNRPNRYNFVDYVDDSEENDYSNDYNDYDNFEVKRKNRRRYQNYAEEYDDGDDEEQQLSYEENENNESGEEQGEDQSAEDDQETENEMEERPHKTFNTNRNRRPNPINNKKRNVNSRKQLNQKQQRKQPLQQEEESVEEDQYEDEDDEQNFYYNKNQESKRSQNELNLIQRGQQSLLKQIKQFTGGQTPSEVANTLNKNQKSRKRLQQATLLIKRNGQTVYVAPELLQKPQINSNKVTGSTNKPLSNNYPQPPLSLPYKRKGQPTQYITIPWNQLGISAPNQLNSLMEGVQSQPLILNIPQAAIENMQKMGYKNKKPSLTADAVPLLAEASIMDVFKPPRIPPARTPTNKPAVLIATKNKIGAARIRPNTIVEKAPSVPAKEEDKENKNSSESEEDDNPSPHFIVIADEPVNSKLSRSTYKQIIDYFQQNRSGRQLNDQKVVADTKEQLIPVQVITGEDNNEFEATTESSIALENPDAKTENPAEENTKNQTETIDL